MDAAASACPAYADHPRRNDRRGAHRRANRSGGEDDRRRGALRRQRVEQAATVEARGHRVHDPPPPAAVTGREHERHERCDQNVTAMLQRCRRQRAARSRDPSPSGRCWSDRHAHQPGRQPDHPSQRPRHFARSASSEAVSFYSLTRSATCWSREAPRRRLAARARGTGCDVSCGWDGTVVVAGFVDVVVFLAEVVAPVLLEVAVGCDGA